MQPRSRTLRCQGRELHVLEWGRPQAEVVVAWHGLARSGRDMDDIAAHLAQRWRVLCPDTLGRGLSPWSPQPDEEYQLGFYAAQALDLLDQLGVAQCHWLGTSMGGAIGLRAAATTLRGRIQRLVMNDIGPELAAPAMLRQDTGHLTDDDPWKAWDALTIPVLVLRGAHSDRLAPEMAEAMRNRGPRAVVVSIPGCGHAPALNTPAQFALVERFFSG